MTPIPNIVNAAELAEALASFDGLENSRLRVRALPDPRYSFEGYAPWAWSTGEGICLSCNRTIRTTIMKRRRHHRDIRKYAHPKGEMKKELTIRQLAAIGAVALAYNELEVTIDVMLFEAIELPHSAFLEVSRINDIEDKIGTINKGVAHLGLEPEDQKQIEEALGIFREFTIYRDAINHARIMNLTGGVGLDLKSGGTASLSLFSDDALNISYDHLMALEKELSSAAAH